MRQAPRPLIDGECSSRTEESCAVVGGKSHTGKPTQHTACPPHFFFLWPPLRKWTMSECLSFVSPAAVCPSWAVLPRSNARCGNALCLSPPFPPLADRSPAGVGGCERGGMDGICVDGQRVGERNDVALASANRTPSSPTHTAGATGEACDIREVLTVPPRGRTCDTCDRPGELMMRMC